jgi:hypothetical protein
MKYLFSLLFLLGCYGLTHAETGLNYQSFKQLESNVAKEKKEKDEKKWKNKGGDRIVFTFGFDNWFHGEPGGFKTKWFSFGWGVSFMYDWPIKGSAVSLAAGGGFHFSYIFHNATMVDTVGRTYFDVEENFGTDVKRSRTYLSYFEIPVELRFRTKPNRKNDQFKIAAGFKFGLRMGAAAKQKREQNGDIKKFTEKGFADLSQIRYGPTFRVGYSSYNLFFFYDLNSLFRKDRGPRTFHGFTAGIQFNGL